MRKLSAAQMQGDGPAFAGNFGPMIDGKLLPEDIAMAFDEGQIVKVPLLIGSNSYEAGFFGNVAKGLSQRLASGVAEGHGAVSMAMAPIAPNWWSCS